MTNKADFRRSSLTDHRRFKKELIPPFNQLQTPMHQVYWFRDLLPEFLWLDALVQEYGQAAALSAFNDFFDALDPLVRDDNFVLDGTISAFSRVPEDAREKFCADYRQKIEWAIERPFAYVLALFPECPMRWLNSRNLQSEQLESIASLRKAVVRLVPGKEEYAGRLRVLPLVRHFKHGKIHIVDTMTELIESLVAYPKGDRAHVESFARTTHNMIMEQRLENDPTFGDWRKAFWQRSGRLAKCSLG